MEGCGHKGTVCVTGGTGYIASWLIMRLLQQGYRVHATSRSSPDNRKDISFLTNLPGASENLKIFQADLDHPETFGAVIKGCTGVFHIAHPINFDGRESEQVINQRAINGTLEILKMCLDSKTVKRVVYTSSGSAMGYNKDHLDVVDESIWSDVEFIRDLRPMGASYYISKTVTERAVLEFAQENGLDVVSMNPVYVHGPFICPNVPGSIAVSMALIFGNKDLYPLLAKLSMVHVDDLASAYIFLLEHPQAKGRYICSSVDITIEKLSEFLSAKYPEFQIPPPHSLKDVEGFRYPDFSSKKLLDLGFNYENSLEEIYDGAIQCCKEKGFL
ncbi:Vestitone reductase [Actinidia chinensis var. chinensis]|uniref:Dihydroflavonol 4-reductase n=1 Tax=Actinidia chinensis var. chinensis TaxID=1590841 RepID=A0A2R6R6H0_ACTCC|nr:Vestitone reductase [Actinidia chinensis var. chinensis]